MCKLWWRVLRYRMQGGHSTADAVHVGKGKGMVTQGRVLGYSVFFRVAQG